MKLSTVLAPLWKHTVSPDANAAQYDKSGTQPDRSIVRIKQASAVKQTRVHGHLVHRNAVPFQSVRPLPAE
jgi:hypothetical protein